MIKIRYVYVLIALSFILSLSASKSYAQCSGESSCVTIPPTDMRACFTGVAVPINSSVWPTIECELKDYITESFEKHREWIETTLWDGNILPALRDMTDELSAVNIHQAFVIGTFFDAKHQLETQASLQKIRARAHKDYHPSTGMCQFGSVSKSLSASERKGELVSLGMNRRALNRALGALGTTSSGGNDIDKISRIQHFKATYCDVNDNGGGLDDLCGSSGNPERINKDIDYTRTVQGPLTLRVDFSDASLNADEQDIFALASNLFSHNITIAPHNQLWTETDDSDPDNHDRVTRSRQYYMELRSLLAKRSVAENSFNAIVGMKSEGDFAAKDYLEGVMKDLGVSPTTDALYVLGEKDSADLVNPSYYAQMEVLTKKLYQNPEFYTNLYDKPVNVRRKEVAMQAIGLMQKFDLLKSNLRKEASIAVLLELSVDEIQTNLENQTPGGN